MKKLTIGMATFDDFDGLYFAIQSIRLHHPEVANEIEFLVIDNHLEGSHGKAVRSFLGWIKDAPVRYIAVDGVRGTAIRDYVFRLANTPYVLCLDCHVLLVPGALRRLIDGFDAGVDEGNLIQGPMLLDNLSACHTHMALHWRDNMWGIWSCAWRCPCGHVFQTVSRDEAGKRFVDFQTMTWPHASMLGCRECGIPHPTDLVWEGHERILTEKGYRQAVESGEPFEIPAHGLGLFACRKDSWVGFSPRFVSFGGEEGYLHRKFKQAGRKTLCVPSLGWLHRFMRPSGVPYPMPLEDRAWNYLVGHRELGLPIEPVVEHFKGRVSDERMGRLIEESKGERS
jgi:hypothetical protein